jgi:hypothetical protein
MSFHARLTLALVRSKLTNARTRVTSFASATRRKLTDGIAWGAGLIAAAIAALTALVCIPGCPAPPPPPANGSIAVAWSIQSSGGLPVSCEQIDARFAALRLRNRTTSAVVATAFPCANSPGTAQVAAGLYDVSFLLNGADGTLLGTAPDQTSVSVVPGRSTELAPVIFAFGVTPQSTVVLRIATSATTNCRPTSAAGAGITSNTIVLTRAGGGCVPATFTRRRGTEERGTYRVNCSSPQIAPCLEKDETLTTSLDRGDYQIKVRGMIAALDCWVRDDTLRIPVGGNVSRTLGLQRANAAGCPP